MKKKNPIDKKIGSVVLAASILFIVISFLIMFLLPFPLVFIGLYGMVLGAVLFLVWFIVCLRAYPPATIHIFKRTYRLWLREQHFDPILEHWDILVLFCVLVFVGESIIMVSFPDILFFGPLWIVIAGIPSLLVWFFRRKR